MPKISIIVPAYNVEPYLNRCIESILAQSFPDFELLLIDDGSADGCGAVCSEYAKKDERVIAIEKRNRGVSEARNAGLAASSGDYIAFIDSDDYVEKDFLLNLWENRTDLTIAPHATYTEKDEKVFSFQFEYRDYPDRDSIDFAYLCDKLYSPCCRLFRRDVIEEHALSFPVDLSWGEDGVFGSRYAMYINNARVLPTSGYHYIKYSQKDSLSSGLRIDLIDDITSARERYISNLMSCTEKDHDAIIANIEDGIRENVSGFIIRLFITNAMPLGEKKKYFRHFAENRYVVQILENKEKYFFGDLVLSLKTKDPVLAFEIIKKIRGIQSFLYKHTYMKLPSGIRGFIKKLLGRRDNNMTA